MFPAEDLRSAYNAVDPTQPLQPGDPRYVDCNDVRGNEDTVAHMLKAISYSTGNLTHQLFTGHRGCGKSTELLRLKDRLAQAGFHVIYFTVEDYLDLNDLIYTDLLLSIARRLEEDFRKNGIDVKGALEEVERWFRDVVYEESEWEKVEKELTAEASIGIGLPIQIPLIARLLAKVTGWIKNGNEVKTEIRHKLDRQVSQLIDQINGLLREASLRVKQDGKEGIAVLMDGLDRMVFTELTPGRTSHDAPFIEHAQQLRALECHIVYTVPISMMYAPKASVLRGIFPDCRVLPMIKVNEPAIRGRQEVSEGVERLRGILRARVDVEKLADPEAVTHVCHVSGGHPRDLLTLVRYSIEYANESAPIPISVESTERAEARLVSAFSRSIPENHFPKLANVFLTNAVDNDEDHQAMLFNSSVLEYANGIQPWYDVHPAVQKLARFQKALEDVRPKLTP